MIIAHNLTAMNAQRQFNIVGNKRKKSTERLSSGYRINRAADDAAGLAISEKMRRQIRGLNQGASNIQDGVSLVQVADGALAEVHDMLNRMTELSVKAANGTLNADDRMTIQNEMEQLADEITRIGKTTTFNGMPIFDDMYGTDVGESITTLVTSSSADTGYLSEAIKVGSYWLPAATVDFSGVNAGNISKLNNQGFSFCCSRGCNEVFDFTFKTDGTPSSASNLSGKVTHKYVIDISGCSTGADVVNTMYGFVKNNLPTNNGNETANSLPGSLGVSHSNYMIKSADSKALTIYANTRIIGESNFSYTGYGTKEEAENAYPSTVAGIEPWAGAIDCSRLAAVVEDEKINEIPIQCSSNTGDQEYIHTHRMNAQLLGIDNISVITENNARNAIDSIKTAQEKISEQRSELGAFQNRLEHSYNINTNVAENTTAAESQIRDTDMADEMVSYSLLGILEQAGISMMSQANQSQNTILSLLNQ